MFNAKKSILRNVIINKKLNIIDKMVFTYFHTLENENISRAEVDLKISNAEIKRSLEKLDQYMYVTDFLNIKKI